MGLGATFLVALYPVISGTSKLEETLALGVVLTLATLFRYFAFPKKSLQITTAQGFVEHDAESIMLGDFQTLVKALEQELSVSKDSYSSV